MEILYKVRPLGLEVEKIEIEYRTAKFYLPKGSRNKWALNCDWYRTFFTEQEAIDFIGKSLKDDISKTESELMAKKEKLHKYNLKYAK